jgi:valyl-tRNA synthetase
MDPEYSRCVQRVFVELYKKGLDLSRQTHGELVTRLAHRVVRRRSRHEGTKRGAFIISKSKSAEEPGTFLTIATTRPETIPGDTAVAVNPKDPRYAKYIGKHVLRPLPANSARAKLIPIIGDEHVDFEFGTGVLKVTPAHDKADFEIGQRHKLAQIEVIDPTAT